MWKTLAIIGAAYACIFILLMLGHLVYFVRNNYMDDFSERFRAYSKKNNEEIPDPRVILKDALQKMGCKLEVNSENFVRATFRDTDFYFYFDWYFLRICSFLKCIPEERSIRRLADDWVYEVNSTGNNVRVLVSDDLEEFCLDLWAYIDVHIHAIPLNKKECCRFVKAIFSALTFASQEYKKNLEDLLPQEYSEENSTTTV